MTLAQAITIPEFWYGLCVLVMLIGAALMALLIVYDIIRGKIEWARQEREWKARRNERV